MWYEAKPYMIVFGGSVSTGFGGFAFLPALALVLLGLLIIKMRMEFRSR